MTAEIERRLDLQKSGSMLPFYIEDRKTGRALGMTTLMHIEEAHRRVEVVRHGTANLHSVRL